MNQPAQALLSIRNVSKSFGAVRAVDEVDLELMRGEVLALVGENGAGKSTLMRSIGGVIRPDQGEVRLHGRPFAPVTRLEAENSGVRMVMQELNLIPTLTVAENIYIKELPGRFGWIDRKTLNRNAATLLKEVGIDGVAPDSPVAGLGVGSQQMVEIATALSNDCEILILDEPTAALTAPETERLFEHIRRLKAAGTAIVYISHRMEEIRVIADRIAVLRDGRMVADKLAPDTPLPEIVRHMAGRDLSDIDFHGSGKRGPEAIRVEGLSSGPVKDLSFAAYEGEILGFAGLMGAGRTETMRATFGADKRESGEVYLHGEPVPATIKSPAQAVRQGLALLTEDRKSQGLLLPLAIRANITLNRLHDFAGKLGLINAARESQAAQVLAEKLAVRCTGPEHIVGELSGGNQQKVVIARWLCRDSQILIFDEPTRGIDIGARFEIYALLRELAGQGKAIIVVSSDMKELLALCDRILVMSAGCITAEFERSEFDQEKIMAAALQGHTSDTQGNVNDSTVAV